MASYDHRPIQSAPVVERLNSYLTSQKPFWRKRAGRSAHEDIRQAYNNRLVPSHLFGQTQHKTLGARLSEDILLRRERSAFSVQFRATSSCVGTLPTPRYRKDFVPLSSLVAGSESFSGELHCA